MPAASTAFGSRAGSHAWGSSSPPPAPRRPRTRRTRGTRARRPGRTPRVRPRSAARTRRSRCRRDRRASPPISLAKITTIRIMISVTEIVSIDSSARVVTLMSLYASKPMMAAATSAITTHSGSCQIAGPVEERRRRTGRPRRTRRSERQIGAEQRPAGEEPGLRAERHSAERVDRSGMCVVAGQADEGERDQQHADRGHDERQRHRPPDVRGDADAVQRHRGGRRHDPDRERDRLPEAQLAPKSAVLCGALSRHQFLPSKSSRAGTRPPPSWARPRARGCAGRRRPSRCAYASCRSRS